ncbi:histone-lysine N-methyltransferase ASHR1 isoform X2 [Eurytemora carolleeae]|uniref:histone-lysine N-methyltransferase ASHR1 isoform X2 n=1 Tax=Eurytemora carolleeae TaxID=1294199 RepID=UPI000C782429|nr:histone-lysine N-methyltransferase ASHR1 isoform X2 [Eurytemora carolleeae]|eukprot:XP_023320372.1 histone-lysine N-methyltransferase ASHR1-like isoform X2 [Eurytemora affinis]
MAESCAWIASYAEGKGRILVATKDIYPNQTVLTDSALLSLPDGLPVCLGCLTPVQSSSPPCPSCSWLSCSDLCPQEENHRLECKILTSAGLRVDIKEFGKPNILYSVIAILKTLLFKAENPEKYEIIETLMDHWEERRKDLQVGGMVKYIGALIRKRLGLQHVSDAEVEHVFGVLKTNGVGQGAGRACYIYPIVSLMSHACRSNLEIVGTPGTQIQFRAKTHILAGEELTWSYTSVLDTRSRIRERLKETWMFECTCSRCSDPTEFGTFFSSTKCACGGYLVERNEGNICLLCGDKENTNIVQESVDLVEQIRLYGSDEIIKLVERLESNSHYHPSHHIYSRITMRLLDTCFQSLNEDLILKLKTRGEILLRTLETLLGENSRPYSRYKSILELITNKHNKSL